MEIIIFYSVWYKIKITGVTFYERYTSALCSPSRLSLGTALVRRSFITKDTSV